jgi:hypothetical protein
VSLNYFRVKKLPYPLHTLIFFVAFTIVVSCEQEAQVEPGNMKTESKIFDRDENSPTIQSNILTARFEFSPSSGIAQRTQVIVDVYAGEEELAGGDIIKFAGCQPNGTPSLSGNMNACDGVVATILSIRYLPRFNLVRYTVLVPVGAETGKIIVTRYNGFEIPSEIDFKVHTIPVAGLVAFYPFDQHSYDVSGNALHGYMKGFIAYSSDRSGNPNSAFYFDGQDDYLDMGNPAKLQITGQMTMAAWIRYTSTDLMRPIISKTSNAVGFTGYALNKSWFPGSQTHAFVFQSWPQHGSCLGQTAGNITPGLWTFITVTVDGPLVKSYQDGQLLNTWDRGCGLTTTSLGNFMVGKTDSYDPSFFRGNIDNVAVYNRVLTDAEVMQLYQQPN